MQKFCELHYIDSHQDGEEYDQIILFLHAILTSSVHFNPLCKEISLKDSSVRLVRVDLRGFGKSQTLTQVENMMDFTLDVENFIRTVLKLDDDQAKKKLILVGWSLGSSVCMQLGATFPNLISKMVLVASAPVNGLPVYSLGKDGQPSSEGCTTKEEVISNPMVKCMEQILHDKDSEKFKGLLTNFFFKGSKQPDFPKFEYFLEESLLQSNYSDTMWALQQFDLTPRSADTARFIQGPVLLIHGRLDVIVSISHAERIVKEIVQDRCKLIIADYFGHMIPMEDPSFVANEILDFIKS